MTFPINFGNSENSDPNKGVSDLLISDISNDVDDRAGERKIYIFRLGKAKQIDDFAFRNLEVSWLPSEH